MQCANPSSFFLCICGLIILRIQLVIVFAGGGDSGVCVMGGGITDMCGRVHAITETLFFHLF